VDRIGCRLLHPFSERNLPHGAGSEADLAALSEQFIHLRFAFHKMTGIAGTDFHASAAAITAPQVNLYHLTLPYLTSLPPPP
jgi:hypothetical protein